MVRIIHTREPAYVSFWNKRAGQRERGPQPHHLYRGSRKQSLGKAKCPGLSPMWPRLAVLIPGARWGVGAGWMAGGGPRMERGAACGPRGLGAGVGP